MNGAVPASRQDDRQEGQVNMKLKRTLIALMVAIAMALVSADGPGSVHPASAQSADSESRSSGLFYEVDGDPLPSNGVDALKSRLVGVDLGQLSGVTKSHLSPKGPVKGQPPTPQKLILNLFDDAVFTGIVEHVEPTASGHALWGRLDGVELGTMTMVVNGKVVVGTVRTPNEVYSIRTVGDAYVIRQIDESSLPPLGEPLEAAVSARDDPPQSDDIPPDDGSEIDVMVVYTPLAKHREGGRAAIEALIDLFVAETNQAYANSGVIHQLNLVLREEVDYIETGKATDLGRLRDTSDGFMDHVHERRDLYAADFVHFVVGKSNRGGGAIQGGAFAMTASYRKDLVFAHELGHNMGLFHDRYVEAPGRGAHYGYVNQRMFDEGAPRSARWRTIMAYPNQCSEVGGFSCPQVQYFSNPDNTYKGDPMGVSSDNPSIGVDGPADAVQTLNTRREFNANRRRSSTSPTPRVALNLSPYWLAEDGGVSAVTATLHRPSSEDTVVTISASPTDAVTLNANRTLTIPAGETVSIDSVTIAGVDNGDETGDVIVMVSATAENTSALGVIAPEPVDLAIADDETTPVLTLTLSPEEVFEGRDRSERRTLVTARLDNVSSAETTVRVSASPIEAVERISWNTLTIPAGQKESKGGVYIVAVDDTEFMDSKKVVTVSGTAENSQVTIGPDQVTLTIIDDDGPYFVDDSVTYSFTEGVAASRVLPEAAYGDGLLTYSISPTLSNGVIFVPGPTAMIGVSKTSAAADVANYTLTATDADGDTDTMTVSITVRSGVCPNSTAVSGYADPEIAADCESLLSARDALRGDQSLNWSESISIDSWQGVAIAHDRIVRVDLSSLNLTGTIPSELGNLTGLQSLDLSENELASPIPAQLGNLNNLESLVLYRNQLTGPIPLELGDLGNLHTLRLGDNRLIGEIPSELGRLSNLQELFLGDNQLTGSIPSELSKLSKLSELSFARNQLSGDIPAWLGGLSNLRNLHIGPNRFTGLIPPELGELDKLEWLSLQGNQLTGKIPVWLSGLSNLRSLILSSNQLEGPIPSELGDLDNLYTLWLQRNQLTGSIPPELGNLDNLRSLFLSNNELDGEIPSELGNLFNLQGLQLHKNQLTGSIPADLGDLANLSTLFLDRNRLSGPIPSELGNLASLESLWLHENQLTGPIPPELGNLVKLEVLILYNNQLNGQIPSELGKLANLEVLQLSGNSFSGCMPEGLRDIEHNDLHVYLLPSCEEEIEQSPCVTGAAVPDATNTGLISDCETLLAARDTLARTATLNWSTDTPITDWDGITLQGNPARVAWLNIRGADLGGSVPAELGRLSRLTYLNLRNNGLSGPIPTELGDLTNLRYLGLNNNKLSGPIPDLRNLTNLEQLYLSNNDLSGTLPDWLGSLTKVREFWLWGNELSGPIPDLSGMTGLVRLKLQSNQLTGSIPASFGDMNDLVYLYLHDNALTGEIPSELGDMDSLRYLWLHTNELEDGIPPELGKLSNLWDLNLHSNSLTGGIPAELGEMTNLARLRLHRNALTGNIPVELGDLENLRFMWLHGNMLSGQIPAELGNLTNLERLWLSENNLSGRIPTELGELGSHSLVQWRLADNQLSGCVPPGLTAIEDSDFTGLGLEVCEDS